MVDHNGEKMKVLNLYAGIGGNRKLWEDVEVTAVEIDPKIAAIYSDFFPEDKMVVGDAHQYLLDHYKEFDFIWSSPPCPTHSRIRYFSANLENNNVEPVYPDMTLYQEIIFLLNHSSSPFCVENVKPYYEPLIKPSIELGRHLFWSNFMITTLRLNDNAQPIQFTDSSVSRYGFDLSGVSTGTRKDKILRSLVNPVLGVHILDCARGNTQVPLTSFSISKRME